MSADAVETPAATLLVVTDGQQTVGLRCSCACGASADFGTRVFQKPFTTRWMQADGGAAAAILPRREDGGGPEAEAMLWLSLHRGPGHGPAPTRPLRKAAVVVKNDPDGSAAAGSEVASLAASLVEDIAGSIRSLRTLDGIEAVTEARCYERARNIVAGLLGNYVVQPGG